MKKKQILLIILAVIVIIAGAIAIFSKKPNQPANQYKDQQAQTNDNNNEYNIQAVRGIDDTDHVWGDRNASVQMIIYDDFECPYCLKFYEETLSKIKADFAGKVAIAFRHYPLSSHPQAMKAAEASECAAEQDKFWEMHDKLFADNKAGNMSAEQFKKDAADLGLDQVKFAQCLDTDQYKDRVNEEMIEGKNAGVIGTPTTFVNGKVYPGAYPYEDFTTRDGKQEQGMKNIIQSNIK